MAGTISLQSLFFRDRFIARSFVDTLSYAEGIPLVLVDTKRALCLFDRCSDDEWFKSKYPDKEAFDAFKLETSVNPNLGMQNIARDLPHWKRLRNGSALRSRLCWSSNSAPLFEMLRDIDVFSVWETLYWHYQIEKYYGQLIGGHKIFHTVQYPGFKDGSEIACLAATADARCILISGPISKYVDNKNQPSKTRWDTVSDIYDAVEEYCKSVNLTKQRFTRFSVSQPYLTSIDFEKRIEKVLWALDASRLISVASDHTFPVTHSQDIAAFLISLNELREFPEIRQELPSKVTGRFELRSPLQPMRGNSSSVPKKLHFSISDSGLDPHAPDRWHISDDTSFQTDDFSTRPFQEKKFVELRLTGSQNEELEVKLNELVSRTAARVLALSSLRISEGFRYLRNASVDRISAVEFDETGIGRESKITDICGDLARKSSRIFGSEFTGFARYDYSSKALDALGAFLMGDRKGDWFDCFKRKLSELSQNADVEKSIICRAFTKNQTKWVSGLGDDQLEISDLEESLHISDIKMKTHDNSQKQVRFVSAIAAPLRVFDRPWGVLWFKSTAEGRFWPGAPNRISELAQIFASYFYQAWFRECLLVLNRSIGDASKSEEEKLSIVCETTAETFMCENAAIWLADPIDPTSFKFSGSTFETQLDDELERVVFDVANPRSCYTSEAILERISKPEAHFWYGTNLHSGIFGVTNDDKLLSALKQLGHQRVQVVLCGPPADGSVSVQGQHSGGQAVTAVMLLFSNSSAEFDQRWIEYARLFSRMIDVAASTVRATRREQTLAIMLDAHALKNAVRRIVKQTDFVRDSYDKLLNIDHNDRHPVSRRVEIAIEDLRILAGDIKFFAASIGNIERRELERIQVSNYTTELRDAINQTIKTVETEHKSRSASLQLILDPRSRPRVNMPERRLRQLISDLCDNALKYHDPIAIENERYVTVTLISGSEGIQLVFSNHGIKMDKRDRTRIFKERHRGSNSRGIDGEGMGLHSANHLARKYGYSIRYSSGKASSEPEAFKQNNIVRHRFILTIPKRHYWEAN